jgi:PEP-CTERM motif
MYGLATGTDGVLYGVDGTEIYTINTATGKANYLSSFGTDVICKDGAQRYRAAAAFSTPPVPEPASLALLSVGGLALLYKWKSSSKQNA